MSYMSIRDILGIVEVRKNTWRGSRWEKNGLVQPQMSPAEKTSSRCRGRTHGLFLCLTATLIASCTSAKPMANLQPAAAISPWGRAAGGLKIRLESPVAVEQNAALAVTLELQCDPQLLPEGVTRLNTFLYPAHCQLRLANITTGKVFLIETYDSTRGMLVPDDGKSFAVLDGTPIKGMEAAFPLRSAGPDLQPGDYDCTVSYCTQRLGNTRPNNNAAFWSGEVTSAPVRVKVISETPQTQAILVPKRLTVNADGRICLRSADAESLQVVVKNGMFLGTRISGAGAGMLEMNSGPPQMDSVSSIADLSSLPAEKPMTIRIEVFETPDPPCHMWALESKSETLWTKTFSVAAR